MSLPLFALGAYGAYRFGKFVWNSISPPCSLCYQRHLETSPCPPRCLLCNYKHPETSPCPPRCWSCSQRHPEASPCPSPRCPLCHQIHSENSQCSPPPSTPTFTWSIQEGYDAAAAAFSAITNVKFISERDVQRQIDLGKTVIKLEIKDVFYGQLRNKVKDQEELYYVPDSAYDPEYDHDFTNYEGDDTGCTRGGYPYQRPAGWNRKAVRVIGKYEDDVWLGYQGWRDYSSPGEWPVSYHGTKIENVPSIVAGGYDTKKCVRQAYGPGIYSTPDVNVAEYYATEFNYKGENCKCILQNRVNLSETKDYKTLHGTYFVTPDQDDIRPYGVCIKKI